MRTGQREEMQSAACNFTSFVHADNYTIEKLAYKKHQYSKLVPSGPIIKIPTRKAAITRGLGPQCAVGSLGPPGRGRSASLHVSTITFS